ncbi:MAG: hypothetical protein A3C11_00805 [Candidatus Sungbacteria bacterium RIFCSPHIGHO2_02_FULL_49_12]|uniref:Ribonuclease n=1 Tax=Candidatus Sungbacteria bacterium RIFCSPHIGHO2_02_FULL_49_12 TaxID=1802271 RepID=A0A1G2KLI2_9BACT|nr:MAG: hypothetical protein A3C11_00805 [Candidatus Sungbacteria bacterium RIFCSPHIGHO2_02_FULL_49_12]
MRKKLIGGIDEAGRGPLAGPVSLAMVVAPRGFRFYHPKLGKIRDSKKLSPAKREDWYRFLVSHPKLSYVRAFVHPRVIDRVNIARATDRGAARLVRRAARRPRFIYLDGALSLPHEIPHRVVIKGDERIPIVAAASIIAKVARDRYMVRKAKIFPQYKFAAHKGYGTQLHIKLLRAHGSSPIHRNSFISHFV